MRFIQVLVTRRSLNQGFYFPCPHDQRVCHSGTPVIPYGVSINQEPPYVEDPVL